MAELIQGLSKLTFWSWLADFHGALAMLSLILFGAGIVLYFLSDKIEDALRWLKITLLALFADLVLLDIFGLTIYIPYRAEGGPRTILKGSEDLAWLHNIIFEHKEFLAFAPPILILAALVIVSQMGGKFNESQNKYLRLSVITSLILSLIFVLVVAGEAVLVTKTAPV